MAGNTLGIVSRESFRRKEALELLPIWRADGGRGKGVWL